MQEDLPALFSRNLNISNSSQNPTPPQSEENHLLAAEAAHQTRPITYSISQHYHHSAHIAAPIRTDNHNPSNAAIISVLAQHGIDPMSLSPSQFDLIQQAEPGQRLRLLELWRTIPPSQVDRVTEPEFLYGPATREGEEDMASINYEPQMQTNGSDMASLDEFQMDLEQLDQERRVSLTPMEGGDGRSIAEPYILSGYESLSGRDYIEQLFGQGVVPPSNSPVDHKSMVDVQFTPHMSQYNHSTEPVYQHPEMWQKYAAQQSIEPQYGVMDQTGRYGGPSNASAGTHAPLEDEEML
ncbi:MAG: hypothetical protein M1812_000474 [Candelaria pacifica]|nr:MAG: hypothetical protein M1812_000474 [Candelaria pacifica]